MKDDYKYETVSERFEPIDTVIDTQPTRLVKYYYQLLKIMDAMDEALRRAGEHPVQLRKDYADGVQNFLEEGGEVLQKYELLFNNMDEF